MPGRFSNISPNPPEAQASAGLLLSVRRNHHLLWNTLLDLVFPPRCTGCGLVDTTWCSRCQGQLEALPLDMYTRHVFDSFETASSGEHIGYLQAAVQALKYARAEHVAITLGERLSAVLHLLNWSVDLIVPVPLHAERLRTRGYNQADLIARAAAEHAQREYAPNALMRIRHTRSQVGLDRSERLSNVTDAFIAEPEQVRGQRIILVDDVLTTGATLFAGAEALYQAGAEAVYGLTVTTARPD